MLPGLWGKISASGARPRSRCLRGGQSRCQGSALPPCFPRQFFGGDILVWVILAAVEGERSGIPALRDAALGTRETARPSRTRRAFAGDVSGGK